MGASVRTSVKVFYCIFVGLLVLGGSAQAQPFAGGTGEAGDPYEIATAEQLVAIGSDPNLLDKCFVLTADIDLDPNLPGGRVFDAAPIAPDLLDANGLDAPGVPFTGSFDGRDHVILNLVILAPTRYAVGLFGRIGVRDVGKWGTPGVVQNVRLEAVAIDGHELVGALAGSNEGTILKCSASGSVTGQRDFIGGLAGYNTGTVTICHTEGRVSGHDDVGGLVGTNPTGVITHCSFTGTVRGSEGIGGLAGGNSGHIAACRTSGLVDAGRIAGGLVAGNGGSIVQSHSASDVQGYDRIGGFVASSSGPICDCSASGTVNSYEEAGGFAGWNSGTITRCYASGDVNNEVTDAGGFVWSNHGSIAQCYARGDVTSYRPSGGLVGYNAGSITTCYAVGRVQVTGDEGIGGLVGDASSTSVESSFWDVDTTGFSQSNGGIGLPTADLQTAQTYLDAGWDFVNTWIICEGADYPRFQWEEHNCEDDG